MNDNDPQREILRRLREIEAEQRRMNEKLEKHLAVLAERCPTRAERLDAVEEKVAALEAEEHKRKGGKAVLAALLGLAGAAGAVAAKMLE